MKTMAMLKKCLFNCSVSFPYLIKIDEFIKNLKLMEDYTYFNIKKFMEDVFNTKIDDIEDFIYTLSLESRTELYNKFIAFLIIFNDLQELNDKQSIEQFSEFCNKYLVNDHIKYIICNYFTNFNFVPSYISPLFEFYMIDKNKFNERFNIFVNNIVESKSTEEIRFYIKLWLYGIYFIDLLTYIEIYGNRHCGRSICNLLSILSMLRTFNPDYNSFSNSFNEMTKFIPSFLYNCFRDDLNNLDYKLKIAVSVFCLVSNENTKNLGNSLYNLLSNEYKKRFFIDDEFEDYDWILDIYRAPLSMLESSLFYKNTVHKALKCVKIKLYLFKKMCDVLEYMKKNNIDFLSYINNSFEFTCFLNNVIYMRTLTEKDIKELVNIGKNKDIKKFIHDKSSSTDIYMNSLYSLANQLYESDKELIDDFKKLLYKCSDYNLSENFIKYFYNLYKDLVFAVIEYNSTYILDKDKFVSNFNDLDNFINYFNNISDKNKESAFRTMNYCIKRFWYRKATVIPEFILYVLSASNENSIINRVYNVLRSYKSITESNTTLNYFDFLNILKLIYILVYVKLLNMSNSCSDMKVNDLEKEVYQIFYEILDNRNYNFINICKKVLQ